MRMPSKISKWLSAYKPSSPEAIEELAVWMCSSPKLIEDIDETLEKMTSANLISEVCQRLFIFYKSGIPLLQQFVVLLLPSLIHSYLSHSYEDSTSVRKATAQQDGSQNSFVAGLTLLESCLIGICSHYLLTKTDPNNVNYLNDDRNFRLPTLATPSPFHDPVLSKELPDRSGAISLHKINSLTSQRMPAITCLIQNYIETLLTLDILNPKISVLSFHSLDRFTKLTDRIASLSKHPRIPASSSLLMHLLNGSDLILFKLDHIDKSSTAYLRNTNQIRNNILDNIVEINRRSSHYCFSACLLMCQSMLHYRATQYGCHTRLGKKSTSEVSVTSVNDECPVFTSGLDSSRSGLESKTMNDSLYPTNSTRYIRSPHTATTEVITNASFRPEIISEDITPTSFEDHSQTNNSNPNSKTSHTIDNVKGSTKPHVAIDSRQRINDKVKNQTAGSDYE